LDLSQPRLNVWGKLLDNSTISSPRLLIQERLHSRGSCPPCRRDLWQTLHFVIDRHKANGQRDLVLLHCAE